MSHDMGGVSKSSVGRLGTLVLVGKGKDKPEEFRLFRQPSARPPGTHRVVNYNEQSPAPERSRSAGAQMAWRQLNLVCEYIEVNLHQSLTVTELATVAGLSPTHFNRLFRQTTGQSPYRYVRRQRLDQAERLIVETQLPFRDIARSLGFSDQSHLNRMLRADRGLTPGQLRRAAN